MQCGDSSVFSTEEHYAALLILVSIIHENFRLHCGWPIELPPLCKNVSKITKSNARPYESVPEELWLLFHNVIISQLELGPPVDWLIEWPPLSKNMFKKITKSNARPDESVPEEPPFSTLRTPDELIGVQIDSIRSLIQYNLFTDGIYKFNFGSHGDLQKQTKTHSRPTVGDCVQNVLDSFQFIWKLSILMYVVNLEMDNSLKWFLFNIVSGQMANDSFSKWGEVFLLRIWLCFFFIPKGARKYPQTNSYNFAMTLISQHDHLTAGAWAACGLTNWITSLLQKYVKNHKIERTSWLMSVVVTDVSTSLVEPDYGPQLPFGLTQVIWSGIPR